MSRQRTRTPSPIDAALRQFEATEANLEKLERLFSEVRARIPSGIYFGSDPNYEELRRAFMDVLASLPKIDGWKPEITLLDLNTIAQSRLDAQELGEISVIISVEEEIEAPERALAEYRYRLNKMRRQVIRGVLSEIVGSVDEVLRRLQLKHRHQFESESEWSKRVEGDAWDEFQAHIREIDTLLGSGLPRPPRWDDFRRHVRFGQIHDLSDILNVDWPAIRVGLNEAIFGANEPIPVQVDDLATLASARPRGSVATKLNWTRLEPEQFERLIFALISGARGYENPEWLMKTDAPDRGRDLSVTRVTHDPLGGVIRSRVIIQCKHWPSHSVNASDVAQLKEQMGHWEPPRVDVLVVATTGRFSSDAVSLIERHNNADRALRIEMWPESHLERLLAERPGLIAEFSLR